MTIRLGHIRLNIIILININYYIIPITYSLLNICDLYLLNRLISFINYILST